MGCSVSICASLSGVKSNPRGIRFDEGRLVENLNETTSITYEAYRPNATSK